MSITVGLRHRSTYRYDRPVSLGPHLVRLRPAPHTRTPIEAYELTIRPANHFLNWQQDPFGNFVARVVFPEPIEFFEIDVSLAARLVTINPFDFFLEESAEQFPFVYDELTRDELQPYLTPREPVGPLLGKLLTEIGAPTGPTVNVLTAIAQRIQQTLRYEVRLEEGVQTCEQSLERMAGSCRDSSWLLVELLRHLGLAARFVSGYLVQLTADVAPLDGPAGPVADFTDLHAWAEVYLPGAGWFGLDPTSGLATAEGHIPLACTPTPASAAAISGTIGPCETTFDFANTVTRIVETPRVTLPYTSSQWEAIDLLGHRIDDALAASDVRLTMGGEPTFVSVDDIDSPEWSTHADGETKRSKAIELTERLWNRFAPGAVLHCGQGKWYPGEPLPRWQFSLVWETGAQPLWSDRSLLADPTTDHGHTPSEARLVAAAIAASLGFGPKVPMPIFEDPIYNLWREAVLPVDVDPMTVELASADGRTDLRDALERGLDTPAGWVLPLDVDPVDRAWRSSTWPVRRAHLFANPGISPLGFRLPLDTLPTEPPPPETISPRDPLEPAAASEVTRRASRVLDDGVIHTALTVEERGGAIRVFLPPLQDLQSARDLLACIEQAAASTGVAVVLEGYAVPSDHRTRRLSVTPDPGVIEVNVHPSASWSELVSITQDLYDAAHVSRLSAEKFDLDGRHTGTGGGNHITLGGRTPADSPFLRRPGLLTSLISYWQHHPSLSYLFSGQFIGPTSQAPRVDEARHDNLNELEVAFAELERIDHPAPWVSDRALRHLLTDLTGNTHRSEFCIDKLYSPDSASGRLGLLELRAFEMPPHPQMALVQALLVRTLVARFWDHPYAHPLIRWGGELHDRWMLPHYVAEDIRQIVDDLNDWGVAFDASWLDPFLEFRFPHIGTVPVDGIEFEVRSAIEPWPVLGEEVTSTGTARYVDSSMERIQVRLVGATAGRHEVLCNGRLVPLRLTSSPGELVGGVRYRAWDPPSALHPTIGIDTPLSLQVFDRWRNRTIGGCTYHVVHPGGRSYEVYPVNALEAEARRSGRFEAHRHTEQAAPAWEPVEDDRSAGTQDQGTRRGLDPAAPAPVDLGPLDAPLIGGYSLDLRSRR